MLGRLTTLETTLVHGYLYYDFKPRLAVDSYLVGFWISAEISGLSSYPTILVLFSLGEASLHKKTG